MPSAAGRVGWSARAASGVEREIRADGRPVCLLVGIDDGHAIRTCWARAYGRQVNVGAMDEAVNGTDFSAERDLAPAARIADLRLTVLPIIEATLRASTMCMERREAERPVLAQRQAVEQQAVMQRHVHGLTMKRTNKQAA
ncbi:hypothetical protein L1887_50205 [Cichorium endivia]|nr:hypothetical protein L1887_50205 [Cichorium endivia]